MKVSLARVAAFDILRRIDSERAFTSVLLPIYEEKLAANDRALTHELVLGVLRRQMYLDRVIDQLAHGRKLDIEVRIALRLGAYQLLSLSKVPAYSAINESVNIVQRAKKSSARGLVNAILRRISEGKFAVEYADGIERIAVETSHPRWLIEKWSVQFGSSEAEELAKSNNAVPRMAFRRTARTGELEADTTWTKSEYVEGCYIARSLTAQLRTLADNAEVYFQDEASQIVARAVVASGGGRVLDVCAAPGGKTTQIARDLEKASITAGDFRTSRIVVLRAACVRQGAGYVNVVQYDAETALPFAESSFDTVLVDAPCTGTGTIRHNPEIRYFLDPGDPAELSKKQLAILTNASKVVKPGGRLIYSTCSLETEEDEQVCDRFQNTVAGFARAEPKVAPRFRTEQGFARTFPHRDGMDGFFIAEFDRVP